MSDGDKLPCTSRKDEDACMAQAKLHGAGQVPTEGCIRFEDDPRSVDASRIVETYRRTSYADCGTMGGVSAGRATANANGGIV